jgi:putative membrane protein insertion efficiency factor
MRRAALGLIRFYQRHLRRFHNRVCIYRPSCSEYAILCIERYGMIAGIRYAYLRIKRCNGALYAGGEDWPDAPVRG